MNLPLQIEAGACEPVGLAPPWQAGTPLVSVIVTNHNYGEFVEACLVSICGQSYPNIECIVIDDASIDGSAALIDSIIGRPEFAAPGRNFSVIKNPVGAGQIKSSIDGFAKSTGKYVIFFDSDDLMLPHCVEAHITAFFYSRYAAGISSVDIFYLMEGQIVSAGHGGLSHYLTSGAGQHEAFSRKIALPFTAARADIDPPLDLNLAELHHLPPHKIGWFWGNSSALCFRREMVVPMFARNPDLPQALDNYLLLGIHPFTGSILIDRPLIVYRAHTTNAWIVSPRIENLFNWNRKRHWGRSRRIANEIFKTYLASADFYAEYLMDDDLFLKAVERLFVPPWTVKIADHEPFSMRDFLVEHADRLKSAFGEVTYARWQAKYPPPGRLQNILMKLGWFDTVRAMLRSAVGDRGIARLRRLFGG